MIRNPLVIFVFFITFYLGYVPAQARGDASALSSGISETEFNETMDQVARVYTPIVQAHQKNLIVRGKWDESTVHAWFEINPTNMEVVVTGGLVRRPEMTPDVLVLVICHELGHLLGGFPTMFGAPGAAIGSQGQADYYATQVCARRVWRNDTANNAAASLTVDPTAKKACDEVYERTGDRNLCYRTANTSLQAVQMLFRLERSDLPEPSFSTPDQTVVEKTTPYMSVQCRLDTLLQGSLCRAPYDLTNIPGVIRPNGDSMKAEIEAAQVSCTEYSNFKVGRRPLCWFKPRV